MLVSILLYINLLEQILSLQSILSYAIFRHIYQVNFSGQNVVSRNVEVGLAIRFSGGATWHSDRLMKEDKIMCRKDVYCIYSIFYQDQCWGTIDLKPTQYLSHLVVIKQCQNKSDYRPVMVTMPKMSQQYHYQSGLYLRPACLAFKISQLKGVLYSMLGHDLVGLTVAVWNIVGRLLLNQGIKREFKHFLRLTI